MRRLTAKNRKRPTVGRFNFLLAFLTIHAHQSFTPPFNQLVTQPWCAILTARGEGLCIQIADIALHLPTPPFHCRTGKRLYQRPNNYIIPHHDPHIPLHSPMAHIMAERDFGFATGGDAHLERRRKLGSGGSASVHEVPS